MWKEPLVNEELPSRILCGSVVLKSKVTEFTETSAHFGDGTTAENLDVVIFTTGYNFSFPFLEESIIKVDNTNGFLYKMIFPPDLQKPTLAVIGLIMPIGSMMTTAELQSRWATKVFKGLHKLPNTKEIQDDLAREVKQREKWFATSKENARRTDYIIYMDDLASLIGVKPNIFRLFLSDPVLAMKMFFGPCNPYQYRLTGPGKWAGAREAILNQWDRIDKPIRSRVIKQDSYLSLSSLLLGVLCFVALIAAFLVKS
ncbi:hypothetical protein FKM82_002241 [Ascaphus truei]